MEADEDRRAAPGVCPVGSGRRRAADGGGRASRPSRPLPADTRAAMAPPAAWLPHGRRDGTSRDGAGRVPRRGAATRRRRGGAAGEFQGAFAGRAPQVLWRFLTKSQALPCPRQLGSAAAARQLNRRQRPHTTRGPASLRNR